MYRLFLFICLLSVAWACGTDERIAETKSPTATDVPIARHFDFPVGKPGAARYYNAQKFGRNHHLGDDWNGNGGGNTDLGDPIYSIANGRVSFAKDVGGGWGSVLRIVHTLPDGRQVESLYGHCQTILVDAGDIVRRGQQVATIGNNRGQYLAHLHLELRSEVGLPIGGGYSSDTRGFLDPTAFIRAHR